MPCSHSCTVHDLLASFATSRGKDAQFKPDVPNLRRMKAGSKQLFEALNWGFWDGGVGFSQA